MFAEHINSEEFEIPEHNLAATARRELRIWMKRGLIVERENLLLATNSLEQIFSFLDSLENEAMTSTASRLATVQREIENLEAKLNPAKESRAAHLKSRIARLQNELEQVERGEFEVLDGSRAEEGVREIYQLAMSLRADFRRVEDSYRDGDRRLRQQIVRSDQNRGDILDRLLDGHEELLKTTEGQVFDGFYEQLTQEVKLNQMKSRLRAILAKRSHFIRPQPQAERRTPIPCPEPRQRIPTRYSSPRAWRARCQRLPPDRPRQRAPSRRGNHQ